MCLGPHMVNIQGNARSIAVDALAAELGQQVFADFVTGQRALLVFDTADFRVLHELGIKFDVLEGELRHRVQLAQ